VPSLFDRAGEAEEGCAGEDSLQTACQTPIFFTPPHSPRNTPVELRELFAQRRADQDSVRCGWLPRDRSCIIMYLIAVVSLVVLAVGIVGLFTGFGDDGDKCTFVGFITTILGLWIPSPISKNTSDDED